MRLQIGLIAMRLPGFTFRTLATIPLAIMMIGCQNSSAAQPQSTPPTTTPPLIEPTKSGWLPYWDDGNGLKSFEQNARKFKAIHPFWYQASSADKIAFQGTSQKSRVMDIAKSNNVKVIPTVTATIKPDAFKALLEDASQRTAHATAACEIAVKNSYDGIDINYERFAVTPTTEDILPLAQLFSVFIEELATCLHSNNKTLEVTVMARTNDDLFADYRPKLAIGVYDYTALGRSADVVRPMAYDYSYAGGTAGSLDPIHWVKQVAEYASSKVSPDKIQIGLPTYGQSFAGNGADLILARTVDALIAKHRVTPQRNQATESLTFSYTEEGRQHNAWFDDTIATRQRIELLKSMHISGVCFWAIGYESQDLWNN